MFTKVRQSQSVDHWPGPICSQLLRAENSRLRVEVGALRAEVRGLQRRLEGSRGPADRPPFGGGGDG